MSVTDMLAEGWVGPPVLKEKETYNVYIEKETKR